MKQIQMFVIIIFFATLCVSVPGIAQMHKHMTKSQVQQKALYSCPMHPEVQSDKPGNCPKCGMTLVKQVSEKKEAHEQQDEKKSDIVKTTDNAPIKSVVVNAKVAASIQEIVGHYLELKNGLVSDKGNNAATAGKAIVVTMTKLDKSLMTVAQKQAYDDMEDDVREHAEHIGENAGDIEHQREHFDMLSKDVYDLVKVFGAGQLLYKDFCPMYNDKKGAFWLSEKKEIKNPYYGKKMLTCGSVKEEIK